MSKQDNNKQHASKPKPKRSSTSSKKQRGMDQESVKELLRHLSRALELEEEELQDLLQEETAETESWLDWGLSKFEEVLPAILEFAPMLLAAL